MYVLNKSYEVATTYLQVVLFALDVLFRTCSFICLRLFCRNRSFLCLFEVFQFYTQSSYPLRKVRLEKLPRSTLCLGLRLRLGLSVGLSFSYIYFVSTKPFAAAIVAAK